MHSAARDNSNHAWGQCEVSRKLRTPTDDAGQVLQSNISRRMAGRRVLRLPASHRFI